MQIYTDADAKRSCPPSWSGFGHTATDEVNNLHAITFIENRLRPLIATDDASIQLDRHALWRQQKLAHKILQRARFGKLVTFAVQLYLQFGPMKGE